MLSLLVMLLFAPFAWICSLFVSGKREYEKNNRFYRWMLNAYTYLAFRFLRVKIHIRGMEKVPQGTRFTLVGNHRSKFDPMITWLVFREYDLAFISKPSNFNVFIFGKFIRKCCFMAIDRENPRNALKTAEKASGLLLKNEVSIGVYPEGKRAKTEEMLPFHNGVFKIAQRADVPIVNVALVGTDKIAKRTPWKRTHVYLEVCDVIPKEEVKVMRTVQIGERVRNTLEQTIQRIKENGV